MNGTYTTKYTNRTINGTYTYKNGILTLSEEGMNIPTMTITTCGHTLKMWCNLLDELDSQTKQMLTKMELTALYQKQ